MLQRLQLCAAMLGLMASGMAATAAHAAGTLDAVRAAGSVSCGVLTEPDDYGRDDLHGALDDLGTDLCRAVAAAVLGDARRMRKVGLSDEAHGFAALQSGQIDLLLGATPSIAAAQRYGVAFTAPVFLDGVGLLVSRAGGARTLDDLAGKQVCFIGNTAAQTALEQAAARRHIAILPFPFEENGEMHAALVTGHCAAVADSASRLGVTRAGFHGRIADFAVLAERLTIDPMAPALRGGDAPWAGVVGAMTDALLIAEREGVTAADLHGGNDPASGAITGGLPGIGIDHDWALRAIRAVGNYAELYDRDCGPESELGLKRGVNALWEHGGLLYPQLLR